MGNYKVDNYFNEQFGKLWRESREQRAFDLGYANGMFQLYKYLVETDSIDGADRVFEPIAKSNEHFKKYVELYKDEESEAEKMAYEYQKYKNYKNQIQDELKEENSKLKEKLRILHNPDKYKTLVYGEDIDFVIDAVFEKKKRESQ